METSSRLIPVAKIVRTHGIRGALKVYPYGETLAGAVAGFACNVDLPSSSRGISLTISRVRVQGRHLVIDFEEITDMNAAREVVGCELFLPEDRLPLPREGEYYHYQLLGLSVETLQGQVLGVIKGIIETPGSDVYVVEHEGREVLIPAVEGVILEVDVGGGVMIIDPPWGLLNDL